MIKVNISDGFHIIWLSLSDIPKLELLIPSLKGEEPSSCGLPLGSAHHGLDKTSDSNPANEDPSLNSSNSKVTLWRYQATF
jgi:hypothetical protein